MKSTSKRFLALLMALLLMFDVGGTALAATVDETDTVKSEEIVPEKTDTVETPANTVTEPKGEDTTINSNNPDPVPEAAQEAAEGTQATTVDTQATTVDTPVTTVDTQATTVNDQVT